MYYKYSFCQANAGRARLPACLLRVHTARGRVYSGTNTAVGLPGRGELDDSLILGGAGAGASHEGYWSGGWRSLASVLSREHLPTYLPR